MRLIFSWVLMGSLGLAASLSTGCGSSASAPDSALDSATDATGDSDQQASQEAAPEDDHSGWWCAPHGVPEEECARCDTSLVADFKSKEDWCEKHHRPASQCFICDPSRAEKFAARYEAKFGKAPPQPRK